jgi:nucleoid DNA-binding protein
MPPDAELFDHTTLARRAAGEPQEGGSVPVTMTKRELVIRVANKLGETQGDVARIIEGAFDTISEALSEGHRWELRDFGVFEVKTRASRIGRNPRTGDQVPVPERRVVTFRPGKRMKEEVSGEVCEDDEFPENAENSNGAIHQ